MKRLNPTWVLINVNYGMSWGAAPAHIIDGYSIGSNDTNRLMKAVNDWAYAFNNAKPGGVRPLTPIDVIMHSTVIPTERGLWVWEGRPIIDDEGWPSFAEGDWRRPYLNELERISHGENPFGFIMAIDHGFDPQLPPHPSDWGPSILSRYTATLVASSDLLGVPPAKPQLKGLSFGDPAKPNVQHHNVGPERAGNIFDSPQAKRELNLSVREPADQRAFINPKAVQKLKALRDLDEQGPRLSPFSFRTYARGVIEKHLDNPEFFEDVDEQTFNLHVRVNDITIEQSEAITADLRKHDVRYETTPLERDADRPGPVLFSVKVIKNQ